MASLTGARSHRRIAAFNFLSNIPLDVNTKESKFSFLQIAANSNKNVKLSRTDSPDSVPEESEPLGEVDPDSEHSVHNVHDSVVHKSVLGENQGQVDSANTNRTPRPTSVDVGQLKHRGAVVRQTSEHVIGNTRACLSDSEPGSGRDDVHEIEDDFNLDLQPSIQPVQPSGEVFTDDDNIYRHGSVSGERDRFLKHKTKKLQSSFSAENAGIFPTDFAERKRHRSSSVSTDSGDSVPSRQHSGVYKELKILSVKSEKRIKCGRMVVLSREKAPLVVYSILPSTKHKKQLSNIVAADATLPGARRVSGITRPISSSHEGMLSFGLDAMEYIEDGQDISYSQFLVPSRHKQHHRRTATHDGVSANSSSENNALAAGLPVQLFRSVSYDPNLAHKTGLQTPHKTGLQTPPILIKDKGFDYDMTSELVYDPNMLDDPELSSGKHRTLLTFTSYMTSIIDYCKPSDLKQELNEKFKERFPHISLTLSKLRSLKRDLKKVGHVKCSIDLWTVAQSYTTFEKLILKGLINKQNRKLCAGASLLLSAKLNDIKKSDLTKLIDEIEDSFKVQRKELLAFEVAILIALEFTLHIPDYEVYPHYQRLMYTS
ncbi:CDK5 and ABL1 enzyme substrate 2-like [Lineus longissimus]|uniref:CDK5 and ABL1 enzyme substrate 2-like n=1 Tax=Lineus longissimus TaxID=88925 RepID=UPI00315D7A27